MSNATQRFLRMLFFLSLSAGIVDVVTSILIWEKTLSMVPVIMYMSALFISIIPFSFLIGILVDKKGGQIPYFLALVSLLALPLILLFFPDFASNFVWVLGCIAGLANTAFYLTSKVVAGQNIPVAELDFFNARFSNFIVTSYLV